MPPLLTVKASRTLKRRWWLYFPGDDPSAARKLNGKVAPVMGKQVLSLLLTRQEPGCDDPTAPSRGGHALAVWVGGGSRR